MDLDDRHAPMADRPSPSRDDLLAAVTDDAAATALIVRLQPLVARIARARFGDSPEADDAVQEVLVRVFHRAGQWSGTIPIEHWAARIAVNWCCDRARRRARRRETVLDSEAFVSPGSNAAREARENVERLHDSLGAEDRLVVVLLDLEGRGTAEVAALTGWSRVAIKVRAFRARRKLRALAAQLEGIP